MRIFLIIFSFILFLICIGCWFTLGEYLEFNLILTTIFLITLSIYIIFDRKRFQKIYQGTFFKNLFTAFLQAFLIFAILGLINYLAFKNPYYKDFTKTERNSLTQQTRQILKEISPDTASAIKIISLSEKQHIPAMRALLELYRFENKNLALEYHDSVIRPDLVSKYNITKTPAVIVLYQNQHQDRQNIINEVSELNITNAILKVTKAKIINIGIIKNHGGLDIHNKENFGGSYLKNLILGSNFLISEINLLQDEKIADDISILAILGMNDDYQPTEIDKINAFLKRGGSLFLAVGPTLQNNLEMSSNLTKMLDLYGIEFLNGAVIDKKSFVSGSNGLVPLIAKHLTNHIITKNLRGQFFLPLSGAVNIRNDIPQNFEHHFLLLSSTAPFSWLEKSREQIESNNMIYDEKEDVPGPIGMAVAVHDKNSKMRIIAVANSLFLQNSYQSMSGHFLFFLNSLNWLAFDDVSISFDIPLIEQTPIFISNTEIGLIFYISIIFVPLVLMSLALYFFLRRRRFS